MPPLPSQVVSLGMSISPRAGAAVLMHANGIVAAATEERANPRRPSLPLQAVQFCLNQAGLADLSSVDVISLQSRHAKDWADFLAHQFAEEKTWIEGLLTLPNNLRQELRFRAELRRQLETLGGSRLPEVLLVADEQAIAQGLYSQHPADATGYLLLDVPFSQTASGLWAGTPSGLESVWLQEFPQSLELLTANLAGFCGFRGRMGQRQFLQLAEYGDPRFVETMRGELLQIQDMARFKVNNELLVLEPNRESDWTDLTSLFDEGPRRNEQPISSREIDLAHALLTVVQEWIDAVGLYAAEALKLKNLSVRGQGPLFDRLKTKLRRLPVTANLVGLQDEPLLMAAGAAREGLVNKGVELSSATPLILRPQAAFQQYVRQPLVTDAR